MNVAELIAILKDEDQSRLVIMSKDGEGNGFSPFSDLGLGWYEADSTWSGELRNEEEQQDEEWRLENAVPVVVLWPTN